jgi:regulator of replication initiation timing
MSPRSQTLPRPLVGSAHLKAENDALVDRLGPLMRAMSGGSEELAALRRRARQLQAENAQLRGELARVRGRFEAPRPKPDRHKASEQAR